MKVSVQIGLSVAISGFAVWYSVQGVDFGRFWHDLASARLFWLLPMVLSAIVAMLFRAWRWHVLLNLMAPIPLTPVLHATNIGFMGNMVLPLRAGEVIKPLVVARAGEISGASALASVAVERICDLLMLGVLAVVTVQLVPSDSILRDQLPFLVGVVGLALVLIVLAVRFETLVQRLVDWFAAFLPQFLGGVVREGSRGGLRSLSGLSNPGVFLRVMGMSLLVWMAAAVGFVAGALALDIQAPYLALGIATAVIVAAAVSVPSAPGFIGVFWAGSELALGLFGVDKSLAFSFGVLTWLVQMVVICSLGTWSLGVLGLSLQDLRRAAQGAGDPPEEG